MASEPTNNGQYVIMNIGARTVIDLAGGGHSNGTICEGWQPDFINGNLNQVWQLQVAVEDSVTTWYRIVNIRTGTCIELQSSSSGDGVQIEAWAVADGKDTQLWRFEADSASGQAPQWFM
jgi:alpha-L-fucosidase 2